MRLPWCRASGFASRDARLFRFFCHPLLQSLLRHQVPSAEWSGRRPHQRRRMAACSSRAVKRERIGGVRAGARTFVAYTHPPPTGPRHASRVCCLLAQSAARKQTPHRAPERRPDAATSAMPPGSPPPSSPRTSRPSCLPCRHVAAFQTNSPPTALVLPGLLAPKRKASTQELLAVLAGCGGSQIFTACVPSCGRKSPSSFVPAGSRPCCPSADPQARSPLSPCRRVDRATRRPSPSHPAPVLRARPAATPPSTPAKLACQISPIN